MMSNTERDSASLAKEWKTGRSIGERSYLTPFGRLQEDPRVILAPRESISISVRSKSIDLTGLDLPLPTAWETSDVAPVPTSSFGVSGTPSQRRTVIAMIDSFAKNHIV
jgi:hypothetical protein